MSGESPLKVMILALLLGTMLLVASCVTQTKEIPEKEAECEVDSDCGTGGCSNQICGPADKVKDIITTCEWNAEYECLRITSCSCIESKCQWEETENYVACLANVEDGEVMV